MSICLGRLQDDEDPFVSSLEVRTLKAEAYGLLNSSFVLSPRPAVAFGSNDVFRYPDDVYDRIWRPDFDIFEGFNYTYLANNASTISTSTLVDSPPERIFRRAAVPLSREGNLSIRAAYLPETRTGVYLNMYFSEVSANGKRSFKAYKDGDPLYNDALIVPPYGKALEFSTILLGTQNTTFTLVPTANSTLPPLINGLEVLTVLTLTTEGTASADVDALTVLQDKFQVLQNWTGDPCLPENFNWEWVNCSSQQPPRVTMLSLGGYGLSGSLPDFSALDALEIIDFHNNSLTGGIPAFLAEIPKLRRLNLAYNNFSSIPTSLVKNSRIIVNITGNPLLEKNEAPAPGIASTNPISPPPSENRSNKVSSSFFLLLLLAVLIVSII